MVKEESFNYACNIVSAVNYKKRFSDLEDEECTLVVKEVNRIKEN